MMERPKNFELPEDFDKALRALKRGICILRELDSDLATAAISMKLVDVLGNISICQFKAAVSDMWACCYVIDKTLYESFSETLNKKSNRSVVASVAIEDGNCEEAYTQYHKANCEITKGTGYETLFMEKKHV